jgi:hypothetical protein
MFAAFASSMRDAYRSAVTRDGKQSSGIQLAPHTNSGTSLTTKVKAEPCSSAVVSSRTDRKPMSFV